MRATWRRCGTCVDGRHPSRDGSASPSTAAAATRHIGRRRRRRRTRHRTCSRRGRRRTTPDGVDAHERQRHTEGDRHRTPDHPATVKPAIRRSHVETLNPQSVRCEWPPATAHLRVPQITSTAAASSRICRVVAVAGEHVRLGSVPYRVVAGGLDVEAVVVRERAADGAAEERERGRRQRQPNASELAWPARPSTRRPARRCRR